MNAMQTECWKKNRNFGSGKFKQDNATHHISGPIEEYFRRKRVKVHPWPPGSPDLSPI